MTLRALDLFCGAGGASMGLHHAGYEVTGVDCVEQPGYPFSFVLGDALEIASRPCPATTRGRSRGSRLLQIARICVALSKLASGGYP